MRTAKPNNLSASSTGRWAAMGFFLLWLGSPVAAAATPAWQQAIHDLVQRNLPPTTVRHRVEVLTPLAAREGFTTCQAPNARLNSETERLAGRVMVSVHCANEATPYYVQINVVAEGKYLVAAQDIVAQQPITRADIAIQQGDLASLPRHALLATQANITTLLGQQSRRALRVNSVLQENLFAKAIVVRYGDEIIIEAQGDGFHVTRTAEAMDNGAVGDIIRVRLSNRQLLRVEIIKAGRARPAS